MYISFPPNKEKIVLRKTREVWNNVIYMPNNYHHFLVFVLMRMYFGRISISVWRQLKCVTYDGKRNGDVFVDDKR